MIESYDPLNNTFSAILHVIGSLSRGVWNSKYFKVVFRRYYGRSVFYRQFVASADFGGLAA